MKKYFSIFILFSLLIASNLNAQIISNKQLANNYIKQRGEVYFSFNLPSINNIKKLTKLISIDNVIEKSDGFEVFAYANKKQFNNFNNLNINYQTLSPPSELYKAIMSSTTKNINDWDVYPTYEDYVQMMNDFATNFPEICSLENIGATVEGRELLIIKISDNVNQDETEPEFYYTSSMHGDEITGYVMMLRLIDYLLNNYGSLNDITDLLNNTEIWINPLSNPDGTYSSGNATVNGATRSNANGVDLNRNFPDPQDGIHPDGQAYQIENLAQMSFMKEHNFILSLNFHGGAEVMNYPWDTWSRRHADDAWYQFICREYADTVHANSSSYMTGFNNGITNGYDWYEVAGGRQDYVNYFLHSREVTLEISNIKTPSASSLPNYWNYNYKSLINYIKQTHYGINGVITDANTNLPIRAMISIAEHDEDSSMVFSSPLNGDYHRMIEEGIWELTFSAYGYIPQVISNVTTANYQTTELNIELQLADSKTIIGTVEDGLTFDPIRDVEIKILDTPLNSVFTNSNGEYELPNILEGIYEIKLTKSGYASIIQTIEVTNLDTVFNFSIYPSTSISFENNNFEEADFTFEGNADWTITDGENYDGNYAAKSGIIGNNQSTSLIISVNILIAGEISFYKKVSSESGYDFLNFNIDDEKLAEWSGTVDWSESFFSLSSGEHILKWTYIKDNSAVGGQDAAWIDLITQPLMENGENFIPYFSSNPVTEATVNEEYIYNITAGDLNSFDTLEINYTYIPAWLTLEALDSNRANIYGTPLEENTGTDSIELFVSDGKDTTFQSFNITINPNAISEINTNPFDLVISPNPIANKIHFTLNTHKKDSFTFIVYNVFGKTEYKKELVNTNNNNVFEINIPKLNNGYYFLVVRNKEEYSIKKFIKLNP